MTTRKLVARESDVFARVARHLGVVDDQAADVRTYLRADRDVVNGRFGYVVNTPTQQYRHHQQLHPAILSTAHAEVNCDPA